MYMKKIIFQKLIFIYSVIKMKIHIEIFLDTISVRDSKKFKTVRILKNSKLLFQIVCCRKINEMIYQ